MTSIKGDTENKATVSYLLTVAIKSVNLQLLSRVSAGEKMMADRRKSIVVPIFKKVGESSNDFKNIILLAHVEESREFCHRRRFQQKTE